MPLWLLFIKLLPRFWGFAQWANERIKEGYTLEEICKNNLLIDAAHEDTNARESAKKLNDMWRNRKP